MPRLTITNLMLTVAGLAVVLGAGRVHFSLGSLVLGLVSVAAVRTHRWVGAERKAGRAAAQGAVFRRLAASLWFAAGRLGLLLLGTAAFLVVVKPNMIGLILSNRLAYHGPQFSRADVIVWAVLGPVLPWILGRYVGWLRSGAAFDPPHAAGLAARESAASPPVPAANGESRNAPIAPGVESTDASDARRR